VLPDCIAQAACSHGGKLTGRHGCRLLFPVKKQTRGRLLVQARALFATFRQERQAERAAAA
jgi:hypothetical protein